MPKYDAIHFSPPAPVASVALTNRETQSNIANVPMLIDTGADISLVPLEAVRRIGLEVGATEYEIMTFDETITRAPVVSLELGFLGRTFRGQFLVIDQEIGILGRNILNVVSLLLDGKNRNWSEFQSR